MSWTLFATNLRHGLERHRRFDMIVLASRGIRLAFDPSLGQIVRFVVTEGAREIAPLHRAPWDETGEVLPDGLPPHLYHLGGDFFCAPFAAEKDGAPPHGWPANARWHLQNASPDRLSARLSKTVQGAIVTKELWLCPDQPFVYQRHTFVGGSGRVPVSNHANVSLPNGGLIRASPKQVWVTPPTPLEPDAGRGRSGLTYPATSTDPTAFPAGAGTADLTRYPWFDRHEDFVSAVEAPGHRLGWTAVTRPAEGDVFLSLRRTDQLPMTMLWHSNGGRDYEPWSGRHWACLGVEEGAAQHMLGEDHGLPLTGPGDFKLHNECAMSVSHVIGAVAWPSGSAIRSVELAGGQLVLCGEDGSRREVLFDKDALELA